MICGLNVLHPITQERRHNARQGKQAAAEDVGGELKSECVQCFCFPALSLLSGRADQVLPTKGKLQRRHFTSKMYARRLMTKVTYSPSSGHQLGMNCVIGEC